MSAHSIIRSFDHSIIRNTASAHSIIRSFDHSIIRNTPGFTLIELLIVIGIIAILSAILLGTFAGSTESARAARCLSNMKNLANACQTAGYPSATSYETVDIDVGSGLANAKKKYNEHPGWISWYSKDLYPSESSQKASCRTIGLYSDVVDDYQYALSHGSAYKYIGGNSSAYVCPSHKDKMANVHWSYFMNPNAGGAGTGRKISIEVEPNVVKDRNADRVLLFGEIPFRKGSPGEWFPSGNGGNEETDAVIQYASENIGANHKSAKFWVAHVVFVDGHVEKLRVSGQGGKVMSGSDLRELTEWLCLGEDVSFNGQKYDKLME